MSVKHEKFTAQLACTSAFWAVLGKEGAVVGVSVGLMVGERVVGGPAVGEIVVGVGVGLRVGERVVGTPVVGGIDGNHVPPGWQPTSNAPGTKVTRTLVAQPFP